MEGMALARRGCSNLAVAQRVRQPERAVQPVPGSERHLVSWRLLQPLDDLLHTLRRSAEHGNPPLFAAPLLVAHLVAFFSPALKSLRRIEDVFDHPGVRRKYNLPRLPHSTLSDAHALCDPPLLEPLVADLKARVSLSQHEPRLDELTRKLLAVDGSFFVLAPRVAWALYNKPHATLRQPTPPRRPHAGIRHADGAPAGGRVLRAGPGVPLLPDGGGHFGGGQRRAGAAARRHAVYRAGGRALAGGRPAGRRGGLPDRAGLRAAGGKGAGREAAAAGGIHRPGRHAGAPADEPSGPGRGPAGTGVTPSLANRAVFPVADWPGEF